MFRELHELAQASPLMLTIVAEGEQLRVTVTPQLDASKTVKASPHPLYILATPEELDTDFAAALSIYAPGARSVLEQASAAAAANGSTKDNAPPAKGSNKGPGRGRPRAQKAGEAAQDPSGNKPNGPDDASDDSGSDDDNQDSPGSAPEQIPEGISPPSPAAPAEGIAREETPSDPAAAEGIDPRQIGLELPI